MSFTTSITVGGEDAVLAESLPLGSRAFQRANSIFCPVGPAPSRAWMLMTAAKLDELDENESHNIVWAQTGEDGSASETLTFHGFYIVNAERVTQGGVGDDAGLFLVELADARYLAARKGDTETLIKNIRSYANSADYLTGTSGATWASLATSLWDACEVLGSFPGLPFTPDGEPQNNWFIGQNAWRALCGFLDFLDCAVAYDPLAGTFSIVQLGASQTIENHEDTLEWDGEPVSGNAAEVAATVRVYFSYHRKAYGQERDTELANNWAYDGQGTSVDVSTGVVGASGVKPLWDDLPAILDEDGSQTNTSAMNTRATARKTRYVTRWTLAPQHRVHAGLLTDILPGAKVRAVLWRNWGSSQGGTVTEFVCRSQLVTDFRGDGSSPAWFDSELGTPEREAWITPDLARHSYPNYPRLPNMVQAFKSTGSPSTGDLIAANVDGLHEGRVARWVEGAIAILDNCWIRFIDWEDDDEGDVIAEHGRYYYGRLSGVETFDGSLKPLYICAIGEQTFLGKPDADIAKGSSGTVSLYNRDETDSGLDKSPKALGQAVSEDKWVTVARFRGGSWYTGCWET